jgi:hypothetical protein
MLHQRELAFLKVIPSKARTKKRTTVPAGTQGTTLEGIALRRTTGKFKANELANSVDSTEPATTRPAPGAESGPLPANSSRATGEQAASGGRHLFSPEGWATYAAVADATVAPQKPSELLMPKDRGSDPTEHEVSQETAPGRMLSDMPGPMSGMPVGTTQKNPRGQRQPSRWERINKTPILI